jgi:tRNA nucleotidyltransferase (CCA-adding enzyme)
MTFSRSINSNLSTRMMQALTPEQSSLIRSVAEEASRQRLPLYIVGGFVRDLLLGHPSMDFDLVVEGDAIRLAQSAAAKHGGKVTVHTRFNTAQWFPLPATGIPEIVDFTSARSESYKHPAALPTVKPGKLTNDLCRRDFTINTLALRLDGKHFGELRDDLGGLEDLQAGLVRVLHPASFLDDPTRLFRLARYEQRYGFQITPETLALIPEACLVIDHLSAERVRHELELTLEEEKAASMLKRLAELSILAAVHPALKWNQATQTRFVNGLAAAQSLERPLSRRVLGWALWLMDIPLPSLESIEKRLHFISGQRILLLAGSVLFSEVNSLANKKPSQCVAALDEIPFKGVEAVYLALRDGPARRELHDYLETWRHVKPKTTGHDLKKRGLPPGPAYQSILRRLREAWLDGEVKTIDEEMALLDKLTKKYK